MRHLSGQYNLKENDYTNHSENTIVISDGNQITEYMSSTVNELFSKGMDCVRTVIVYDKKCGLLNVFQDLLGGSEFLYYSHVDEVFYYSTSLQCILKMSGVVPKMDTESLALFQKHGFVPGRRTLLRNIYKLCQGEYIEVSPVGCQIKKRNLRFDGFYIRENFHDQEIEIIDSCFEKLAPAYKLGLPLSSGFDSNLLLERLVKYSSSFNVLTIGDKSHMDETSKVEEICNQLNVKNLNKRIVTHKTLLNYKDIVERLEGAVFEPGIFLQYELAKMSADLNIECLVCGDGADQVFNKNFFEKEDSISEYKFGKNPFELASSLIIKKSGIILNSFGINVVYPYCMRNMIGLALNYREENGKNKELHKKTCELFMNRDHYSLLDKQGGSTMIESLFSDTKNLNDFMSEMKNKKYFRISGEESDHRFGPEYNYLLLDCLSTKFVELFIDVFRVEFDMKN